MTLLELSYTSIIYNTHILDGVCVLDVKLELIVHLTNLCENLLVRYDECMAKSCPLMKTCATKIS